MDAAHIAGLRWFLSVRGNVWFTLEIPTPLTAGCQQGCAHGHIVFSTASCPTCFKFSGMKPEKPVPGEAGWRNFGITSVHSSRDVEKTPGSQWAHTHQHMYITYTRSFLCSMRLAAATGQLPSQGHHLSIENFRKTSSEGKIPHQAGDGQVSFPSTHPPQAGESNN